MWLCYTLFVVKYKFYKTCLNCGKEFGVNKKSDSNRRKYCSLQCSYVSPDRRAKLSEKARQNHIDTPRRRAAFLKMCKENADKRHQEWLDKKVVVCNGWEKQTNEVNITNRELEKYRQRQAVCEICGSPERSVYRNQYGVGERPMKLSIDHDHETGDFRGLLCRRCNRCMGWFDKYKDNIIAYCS